VFAADAFVPSADACVVDAAGWLAGRSCCTTTMRPVRALITQASPVRMPGSVSHQLRALAAPTSSLLAGSFGTWEVACDTVTPFVLVPQWLSG